MADLYIDYHRLVRRAIYKATQDGDSLDDIVNDVFLKLLERISVLRTLDRYSLATYVVYTSRSVSLNFIRQRSAQNTRLYYGLEADFAEGPSDPRDALGERMAQLDLWKVILRLPEQHKDVLYFKYVLDLHDTEIAQALSIMPASVRQLLTRARRAAKRLLEDEEVGSDAE